MREVIVGRFNACDRLVELIESIERLAHRTKGRTAAERRVGFGSGVKDDAATAAVGEFRRGRELATAGNGPGSSGGHCMPAWMFSALSHLAELGVFFAAAAALTAGALALK